MKTNEPERQKLQWQNACPGEGEACITNLTCVKEKTFSRSGLSSEETYIIASVVGHTLKGVCVCVGWGVGGVLSSTDLLPRACLLSV